MTILRTTLLLFFAAIAGAVGVIRESNNVHLFPDGVGVGVPNPAGGARLQVTEPTPGNEVARFESIATNDAPALRIFHSRATAAASATTNIQLPLTTAAPVLAPCPASKACLVEARTLCHCTSGTGCTSDQGGFFIQYLGVRNTAGTLTGLGGGTGVPGAFQGGALDAAAVTSITLSFSGTNANVAVVVPANANLTCHVEWHVQDVGS